MTAAEFTIRWVGGSGRIELHVGREVCQYDTAWHFHHDWQVVLVTAGRRVFEWRGGSTTVGPQQTVIFPPTLVHRGRSSNQATSFIMLYASPETMGIPQRSIPTLVDDEGVAAVLTRVAFGQPDDSHEAEIQSAIHRAVYGIETTGTAIPPAVTVAREWLEMHPNGLHSFNELGRVGGYNPFYLSHLFRQWIGLSPTAFRLQIRLLEARGRIFQGHSVASVAADLGFADQSHLGRQFKRAFGLSPGRFSGLITGRK